MKIFKDKARTSVKAKLNTQSDYQYLSESASPYAEKVRNLLNEFFDLYDYGEGEKNEILSRIRGNDDINFHSACFELTINVLLLKQGYVLEPHPKLHHTSKRPDFLVKSPAGEEFYLELVTGCEDTNSNNLNNILDFFEKEKHSNFWVKIRHNNGEMITSPRTSDLKSKIFTWLDGLNPDDILEEIAINLQANSRSGFIGPSIKWQHEKFEIEITAIPVSKDYRGQTQRLFGSRSSGAMWIDNGEIIKRSLKIKSNKYGEFDKPFIIATTLRPAKSHFGLDEHDQKQALFGSYHFILDGNQESTELRFSGDGLWTFNSQPINTRVSGVWFFDDADIYSLNRLKSQLFFNPWAKSPLKEATLQEFPHTIIDFRDINQFKVSAGTVNPIHILGAHDLS